MNTIDDFLNSRSVSVLIAPAVVDDFLRNGASIYEILDWPNEESPGHLYAGANGYEFEWGQIIETITIGTPEIEGGSLYGWEFCLNNVLTEYHLAGSHLSELADVGMWFLANMKTPKYVTIGDGDIISAFDIHAFNQDIVKTRGWIGEVFLPKYLPRMLAAMRAHLASPDTRIPLREPPCRHALKFKL